MLDKNRVTNLSSNLISIDVARGFASLAVFIYHYGVGSIMVKATGLSAFNALSVIGATYAVPLFFAVSGFCIHLSQLKQEARQENISLNYKNYVVKRFWRIYPTYLIVLLFSCSVQAMEGQIVDARDFIIHIFLLQGFLIVSFNSINLVLWTISIELMFYLLYPVWYKARNTLGLDFSVYLGLTITVVSWIVCAIWLFPYSLPVKWFVFNLWGAWLVGAWLAEKILKDRSMFSSPLWWISGVSAIILTVVCQQIGLFTGRGEVAWASIVTILWIWPLSALILGEKWLLSFSKQWWFNVIKAFAICGQFSYSLYLLHMPLMYFRNILWLGITSTMMRSAMWFISFLAILVISWISFQLFEKPFMQYRLK